MGSIYETEIKLTMKRMIILMVLSIVVSQLLAQKNISDDWGFKKYSIHDEKLGLIEYFIDTIRLNEKAPLILYLQGSEGYPLILGVSSHLYGYMPIPFFPHTLKERLADNYHFVMISKPGVPFYDSISTDSEDFSAIMLEYTRSRIPKEYFKRISLEYRAKVASKVINKIIEEFEVDETRVVIWGSSEGGLVSPLVALKNSNVTHLVSEVGVGLNPFLMYINHYREKALKGALSYTEAQQKVDSLFVIYRDIVENPNCTEKTFSGVDLDLGFTYQHMSQYLFSGSFENFLKLDIPIFIISGAKDKNVPIIFTDHLILELIRNKKDFTYRISAEGGHELTGTSPYDDVILWIEK